MLIEPLKRRAPLVLGLCLAAVATAGCSGGAQGGGGQGGGKGKGKDAAKGPQPVGYVVIRPTDVALTAELAGRAVAYQSSEVRPQVAGLIQKRFFVEGSIVRAGQPLYQIDPSLYRASVAQADANLASARASAEASRLQAERYKPLADIEAVSKQDYTNALATARQGGAAVLQNRAALDTARINLKFTTVPAPISGRIGRSTVTVGALVTTSQTDPLTTIQQLDPMYVDIQESAADLLALRRSLADEKGILPTRAVVRLTLEDGSDYGRTGSVEFSEVVVDQSTGTVTLRARIPNPQGVLLPGMFVRARFDQAINSGAFLVPQQAVSRTPKGSATVFLVGPGNRAVEHDVTADRTQGSYWVVTRGLKTGDKVITEGLNRLKSGQPVRPVPQSTPQRIEPPKNGKGGGGGKGGGTANADHPSTSKGG